MEKKYIPVSEIAKMFGVSKMGVKYWLDKGLKFKTEKIVGRKVRKIISPEDVKEFLKLGVK